MVFDTDFVSESLHVSGPQLQKHRAMLPFDLEQ